jgi:hypothetical protein
MAKISTDIASTLDITARRRDTFQLELEVKQTNADGSVSDTTLDMTGTQSGSSDAYDTKYQVKMSIADPTSGDIKLTVSDPYYEDTDFDVSNNVAPTATVAGRYYGSGASDGGINLLATSGDAGKVKILIPATYMALEPGVYRYDLQVRYKAASGDTATITTWLAGTFTVNADITEGTA